MNTPYGNAQNAHKAYNNQQVNKAYSNVINQQANKAYGKVSNVQAQKVANVPTQTNPTVQKAYQQSINTMPPEQLTYMLYNGAIKFCNLAIEGFEKKDMQSIHNNIIKAENIILELIGSLNEKYDIAKEYKRLYYYIYDCLVESNTRKNKEKLEEAKDFIIWFRDLWKEVITESKKNKKVTK